VDAVAMMVRARDNTWHLKRVNFNPQDGRSFADAMESIISCVIRCVVPEAPDALPSFPIQKGQIAKVLGAHDDKLTKACNNNRPSSPISCSPRQGEPRSRVVRSAKPSKRTSPPAQGVDLDAEVLVNIGIGWNSTVRDDGLNVSVILYSKDGRRLGTLGRDSNKVCGVTLTRGALDASGGDETHVVLDLSNVAKDVDHIFFVANMEQDRTSLAVRGAHCRLWADGTQELARHVFEMSESKPHLLMCDLHRADACWRFEARGIFCDRHISNDLLFREMDHLVFLGELKRCRSPAREAFPEKAA